MYGLLDLAADDLLDLYFAHAGDDDARSVIDVLCHNLESEPSRHSDAANVEVGSTAQLATWVQRARELWNWRRASILPSVERHSNEAAAFVHLFLLEHFSAEERLDSLEVLLPTAAFGKVKVGSQVDVLPNPPVGGQYKATVKVVDRVLDSASETFGVRLELPNPDFALPAGIKCLARFEPVDPPAAPGGSPGTRSMLSASTQ